DQEQSSEDYKTIHISGMYENWFLDYASYVILERAVPNVDDGLKPVHRRILHAMKDLDDGRFNKVANIIGHTMKYHPHGDASIGDALVQLGQKDLLVDTQGNWGNVATGDRAAAPRYIEARLSKFALEVLFNPKTTEWKSSYDGRNKEPLALPVKFPLLLTQGVEGIAVGLASKILPHNFNELIDASIKILQRKEFEIYPDFQNGGLADFSKYNKGLRGGKVRVRAKISQQDKKTLVINEIPFGTTTSNLIDSILSANEKGKIKIRKIDDNTAENVEILIYLSPGVSPDQTIDALYAFTNCEISISPNSCIIQDGTPKFLDVNSILNISTEKTVFLLKKELEIRLDELQEQWHFSSLEKIFIEERIYRNIEKCTSWESIIKTIDKGLDPFKDKLLREVTRDDIIRLTEIKIKRISKYNSLKADEIIKGIEAEMEEVKNHLEHLIDFTITYFRQIKKKYGKGHERKTEIRNFDTIQASLVAAATQKLYINIEDGFAGTSLRKDKFVCDCSDIDDVIVFRQDGTFMVTKVVDKAFIGKGVIHIDVFNKSNDRTIYNMIYRDGRRGKTYVKRFSVTSITRDKEYDLTIGSEGTKVIYFTANPNGEAEVIKVYLRPKSRLKILNFEFDFSDLAIKGRNSKGNIITRHAVKNVVKKEEGVSTLGAIDIWYDDTVKRLNTDERGKYIGAFKSDDKILTVMESGVFKLAGFDLATHFEEDMIRIEKYDPKMIISAVYFDGKSKKQYIKRFTVDQEHNGNRVFDFIGEHSASKLIALSFDYLPQIVVEFDNSERKRPLENEVINIEEFIAVKGFKAKGKRVSLHGVKKIKLIDPLPYEDEIHSDEVDMIENKIEESGVEELQIEIQKETLPEPEVKKEKISEEKLKKSKKETGDEIESKEDDSQMSLEF
ncbi:MAG: DNA gyrase/topoisomerase IV subunit A, partial [Bacteroidales bacterium]|nr:DNA gyrase/topoisomerase IV subunit A [Bacteroidales bacterium]